MGRGRQVPYEYHTKYSTSITYTLSEEVSLRDIKTVRTNERTGSQSSVTESVSVITKFRDDDDDQLSRLPEGMIRARRMRTNQQQQQHQQHQHHLRALMSVCLSVNLSGCPSLPATVPGGGGVRRSPQSSSYWRRCIRWMMSRQSLNTRRMFSVSTAHVKCG